MAKLGSIHGRRFGTATVGVVSADLLCLPHAACPRSPDAPDFERAPGQHPGSPGRARAGNVAGPGAAYGRHGFDDVAARRETGAARLRVAGARLARCASFAAADFRFGYPHTRGQLGARSRSRARDVVAAFYGGARGGRARAADPGTSGERAGAGTKRKSEARPLAAMKYVNLAIASRISRLGLAFFIKVSRFWSAIDVANLRIELTGIEVDKITSWQAQLTR